MKSKNLRYRILEIINKDTSLTWLQAETLAKSLLLKEKELEGEALDSKSISGEHNNG